MGTVGGKEDSICVLEGGGGEGIHKEMEEINWGRDDSGISEETNRRGMDWSVLCGIFGLMFTNTQRVDVNHFHGIM